MGIQMLSGFGGFQSYYRTSEIPTVSAEEVRQQDALKQQSNVSVPEEDYSQQSQPVEDNRSKAADLENISLTFNKEETYEYIGSESGLANLDMQKAISEK